jgi:tetratricopeptide (TPR) repeat protein
MLVPLLAGLGLAGCEGTGDLPDVGSDSYQEAVTLQHSAVARLQVGDDLGAQERFLRIATMAPGEPSAWYNLGLMALRRNEFDLADEYLTRARDLLPHDPQLLLLSGYLERLRDRRLEAADYFGIVVESDPENLKALYALANEAEFNQEKEGLAEAARLMDRVLAIHPNNLRARLERMRIALALAEEAKLQETLAYLDRYAGSWDSATLAEYENLKALISEGGLDEAATQARRLDNMLKRTALYRSSLLELASPEESVAEVMKELRRLPMPRYGSAPADTTLKFVLAEDPTKGAGWLWSGIFYRNGEDQPEVIVANRKHVRLASGQMLPFPGADGGAAIPKHGVAQVDYDYDFRMDLALAGEGGFRLYRQTDDGLFDDVTRSVGLSNHVVDRSFTGTWSVDLDSEGDMDIVLGSTSETIVLRNNGDGTFDVSTPFESVEAPAEMIWADMDADGDPDAGFLGADGQISIFTNERSGVFGAGIPIEGLGNTLSFSVADLDFDGSFDLVAIQDDGSVLQATLSATRDKWDVSEVVNARELLSASGQAPVAGLMIADLDNNAGLDLLISTERGWGVWQRQADGSLDRAAAIGDDRVVDIGEMTGDGRLDLLVLTDAGRSAIHENVAAGGYHFVSIRPRAISAVGDRRINTFAIGGEVEIKAGSRYQKQLILSPAVHFGLADRATVDAARFVWPNGDTQGEFDFATDSTIHARQRLKGSCPWVFTYDGTGMRFVTDFIWRSPLGLRINAIETAGIMTTEDWVKIGRDELVERDGTYEIRITAELWETHFFDHVSLIAVDHTADSEIFVDERFAFPPPELRVHETGMLYPVRRATDHLGRDVSDILSEIDERYLGGFELSEHQGRAEDHFIELDLGQDLPSGRLWLIATGWVYPTDSSINYALGQGQFPMPSGLQLEVLDHDGRWVPVGRNLGFPAGKMKTILVDLTDVFEGKVAGRLRLRTNLEIYWDAIFWAPGIENETRIEHPIQASTAELRYRGFSQTTLPDRLHPEVPEYDQLASTAQVWRDLVGYYTRYGDVTELLESIDDRYVIMNAGDEMAFTFEAPPPPPPGYVRDFVLVGDGWVKDGDFNTSYSTTVRPLPDHQNVEYSTPPGLLEEDPVYQRYRSDWENYHTRYVSPSRFVRDMR